MGNDCGVANLSEQRNVAPRVDGNCAFVVSHGKPPAVLWEQRTSPKPSGAKSSVPLVQGGQRTQHNHSVDGCNDLDFRALFLACSSRSCRSRMLTRLTRSLLDSLMVRGCPWTMQPFPLNF